MTFLARRAILVDAPETPFAVVPANIQGVVAVRVDPTVQVNTAEAQAAPQYYDIIDGDKTTTYPGYGFLYVAYMNTDGSVLVAFNNLPTGVFPHNWAGWPLAVGT